MQTRTKFALAFVAVIALLFGASAPIQASNIDGRIKSSAKKSYMFKTYLKGDAIKIQSKEGVVTLSGTVSDESHKAMAEETIMGLPGVKSVDNQLDIAPPPATAGSDARLGQQIRGMLRMHRSVNNDNTRVTVTDGNVILRGKASSEAQKQLTSEYAKDVAGVKDVDNQMSIRKETPRNSRSTGQKVDDASITSQVKMSLLFHRGTSAFDTKVSTENGVVTLTGLAKDQAEIDLATKRVADINGVKSVNNQMTIEAAQSSTN